MGGRVQVVAIDASPFGKVRNALGKRAILIPKIRLLA
jgi:hypothetical protein